MSRELDIFDMNGSTVGKYTIDDACFELEKGAQAVHDTVIAIMAAERSGSAKTKTRAEKRGGGAKPWRQKGLGRARTGSIRNPVWKNGGTIFGPTPRSYAKKINKKVRALALKRAFSEKVEENAVMVLDKLELKDHKTKNVQSMLNALKVESNAVLIVKDFDENVDKATRNIASLLTVRTGSLNVYQILRFNKVIFTKDALDEFAGRFTVGKESE